MAYEGPVVQTIGTAQENSNVASSIDCPFPSGIVAGDILVMFLASGHHDDTYTIPTDWALVSAENMGSAAGVSHEVMMKVATGSESGSQNVLTPAEAGSVCSIMYRCSPGGSVDNQHRSSGTLAIEFPTTSYDSPSETFPATDDWLVFSTAVGDNGGLTTVSTWPTSYVDQSTLSSSGSDDAMMAISAIEKENVDSENPDAYTLSISDTGAAYTVAIRKLSTFADGPTNVVTDSDDTTPTTATLTLDTGLSDKWACILVVGLQAASLDVDTAGWTALTPVEIDNNKDSTILFVHKDNTTDTSVAFSWTTGASWSAVGGHQAGADFSSNAPTQNSDTNNQSTTFAAVSAAWTPITHDVRVLSFFGTGDATRPVTVYPDADNNTEIDAGGGDDAYLALCSAGVTATSPYAPGDWTCTNNVDAVMLAITFYEDTGGGGGDPATLPRSVRNRRLTTVRM
jgi:hypothetical protein